MVTTGIGIRESSYQLNSQRLTKDNQPRRRNEPTDMSLISVKTKKQPLFTFLQWKVAPKQFDLKVPVNRGKQNFKGQEREYLQKASEDYFAANHAGVRCYKKSKKVFTWMSDVWPFYR